VESWEWSKCKFQLFIIKQFFEKSGFLRILWKAEVTPLPTLNSPHCNRVEFGEWRVERLQTPIFSEFHVKNKWIFENFVESGSNSTLHSQLSTLYETEDKNYGI